MATSFHDQESSFLQSSSWSRDKFSTDVVVLLRTMALTECRRGLSSTWLIVAGCSRSFMTGIRLTRGRVGFLGVASWTDVITDPLLPLPLSVDLRLVPSLVLEPSLSSPPAASRSENEKCGRRPDRLFHAD